MTDSPRFKIGKGETIYSLASVDELSLLDLLELKAELIEIGITETWSDITTAVQEIAELDDPDSHPLSLLTFAVTLWAARRKAGDGLRFKAAVNVPMTSIKWLPRPADRKPAKSSGKPQGAKKPRPTSALPAADPEDAPPAST